MHQAVGSGQVLMGPLPARGIEPQGRQRPENFAHEPLEQCRKSGDGRTDERQYAKFLQLDANRVVRSIYAEPDFASAGCLPICGESTHA